MKPYFWMAMMVFLLAMGPVQAEENLMEKAILSGPFEGLAYLNDGDYCATAPVAYSQQPVGKSMRLEIDLQDLMYVQELRIVWDRTGIPDNYAIWLSKSKVDIEVIDGKQQRRVDTQDGAPRDTVPLHSAYVRYVTLLIPSDTTLNQGDQVRIKEIQIIRQSNPHLMLKDIDALATDQDAAIVFRTNIDAQSRLYVGEDTPGAAPMPPVRFIMPRTDHNGLLTGLSPGKRYRYKIEVTSPVIEQTVESEDHFFTTNPANLAAGCFVTGSFVNLPQDRFVNKAIPPLERLVDGKLDYFTSMAQSGSIQKEPQWVMLDLGRRQTVSQVVLYWWALAYPQDYRLEVSADQVHWSVVGRHLDAAKGFYITTGAPMWVAKHMITPLKGRYVRVSIDPGSAIYVKQHGWDFVDLFEMKVF